MRRAIGWALFRLAQRVHPGLLAETVVDTLRASHDLGLLNRPLVPPPSTGDKPARPTR